MSSEEKKKILQMVEDGKISAEEALTLIKALEENPVEEPLEVFEPEAGPSFERSSVPEFEAVKERARRFVMIPLWVGVGFTVLSSYWLFTIVQNSNYGFWFACAWFPLLFGVLLLALSASGLGGHWLYVDVQQEPGEWPQHITLAFPLPFGLARWVLKNFGHTIRGMTPTNVEAALAMLDATDATNEPLIVNVDEGDGGERVQVYIG